MLAMVSRPLPADNLGRSGKGREDSIFILRMDGASQVGLVSRNPSSRMR